LFSGISPAQEKILTNEQVVIKSVRDAVLKSDCCKGIGDVRLELARSGLARPVSNGLAEAFKAMGVNVSVGPGASWAVLGYDILGLEFEYKKGKSRGFLRQHMIKRALDARIRVTATQAMDGAIVAQEDISVGYSDEIDPAAVELAKSPDIPELAPRAQGSGWARIVEPVVVTAAVGGLVYLFFANR